MDYDKQTSRQTVLMDGMQSDWSCFR